MSANIFVIGLDPFNEDLLGTLGGPDAHVFHPLLEYPGITRPRHGFPEFDEMLNEARHQLEAFTGSVDGIIGYWDFPTTGLAPLLRRDYGLPTPTPEAVARCEHKYWSRQVQAEVVPDLVPRFQVIDPFAPDASADLDLDFPFWLKPVKAHSSFLGFQVHSGSQLEACLATVREHIHMMAEPFNGFMAHVDAPPEIAAVDGYHCIAEELISHGRQCTLEGYGVDGKIFVYGAIDSIRSGPYRTSFSRYQYPSTLPRRVQARMIDATRHVMRHIDYEHGAFNIEFYWDRRTDAIRLLEINSRISKSHSPLFLLVDGAINQQVAIDLVLGRHPRLPHREGSYPFAAKIMIRIHEDAVVARSPTRADIEAVQSRYPEARVRVLAPAGTRLAHMSFQDSYSFEVAEIFLGGRDRKELLTRARGAQRLLGFEFRPLAESEVA